MLRYDILGPLEVRDGDVALRVGGPRERKVLAALLVERNRAVPADRLVTVLWGTHPPATARAQIHNSVSRLRGNLTTKAGERVEIVRSGAGFQLRVGAGQCDADEFSALAGQAGALADRGEYVDAGLGFRAALMLWRGPALGGLAEGILAAEARALEEQRLACLERRMEVDLASGRHQELIGELAALAEEFPLRERLIELQMLALYRAGRRRDALEVYHAARRRMVEETGLDPRPEIERLHEQILRSDPALTPVSVASFGGRPAQLPPSAGDFIGRQEAIDELDTILHAGAVTTVALTGSGGLGKTALALHWAQRVRDRFPDGQLYLDLRGYSGTTPVRPAEAVGRLLRALGTPAERVPQDLDEATATYRSLMSGKRILVVLDNARQPDQVRPLLPGGTGFTLVTGRERFSGLLARDGAHRIELDVLEPAEAIALLARVAGDRIVSEPDAAAKLAEACGFLPLALRITAARLADHPYRSVAEHVSELRAVDRFSALCIDGDDGTSVRATFDHSYTAIEPPAQRMFRLLGLVPGTDFRVDAAAALAGTTPDAARRLLDRLVAGCLLEHRPHGRFALHDPLAHYASTLARDDADRNAAIRRLFDWYLRSASTAADLLYANMARLPLPPPGEIPHAVFDDAAEAWRFLDAERPNLVAAVRHAAEHGPRAAAWRITDALRGYLANRQHATEAFACGHAVLAVATDPDAHAVGELTLALGHQILGRLDQSLDHYERAISSCRRAGWLHGEFATLSNLGLVCCLSGRLDRAEQFLRQALERTTGAEHTTRRRSALLNLGLVYLEAGALRRSAEHFELTLALLREAPVQSTQALALTGLGDSRRALGDLDTAANHLTAALAAHRAIGSRYGEALALVNLANLHHDASRYDQARTTAAEALRLARLTGHVGNQVAALGMLGDACHGLGDLLTASSHYREAIALSSARIHGMHHTRAHAGLAQALLDLGRQRESLHHARRTLAISLQAGYRLLQAQALHALAAVDLAEQHPEEALQHAHAALALYQKAECPLGETRTLKLLERATAHPACD